MTEASRDLEILPGRSIGLVELGGHRNRLPERARADEYGGELDGVSFSLDNEGLVSDAWIDNIRTVAQRLLFGGREVPIKGSLSQLQEFFGGCVEVDGIKGGRFFNCTSGVALGCAYDGSDAFVQLRVKHR